MPRVHDSQEKRRFISSVEVFHCDTALVLERRRKSDSDSTAAAVQRKMKSTHTDSYAPSVYLILRSYLAMYYDYYKTQECGQ